MTTAFWKTIEEIPGLATDRRDWRLRLQDCWPQAKAYLAKTSRFVEQIDCPSPGGEHCPRRVVRHPDGTIRAVCGDPEQLCKSLVLTPDDIRIHELDRRGLFADIAIALNLVAAPDHVQRGARIVHVGDRAVAAGRAFPVFASLAAPRAPLGRADVPELDRRNLPFVLLVTSLGAVEADVAPFLAARRGRVLKLGECLGFAAGLRQGFAAIMSPAELFAPEIALLTAPDDVAPRPVMELPVGTSWGDLRFDFREEAVLNVSYGGQLPTRLEPDQIGMRDQRTRKPNRQWRLLLACAALGGALPRSFPVNTIKGRRPASDVVRNLAKFERGYERQRQLLAAALKARFGIDEDPFSASDDCFEARFTVDASGLRQGRADQRDRNFVDDD